jgi:hypothetical protein
MARRDFAREKFEQECRKILGRWVRCLANVKESNGARMLVRSIVGSGTDVYEALLARPLSKNLHLAPLVGPPDATWGDKIALALAHGYAESEAVDAAMPTHWSFCGTESAFWRTWPPRFKQRLSTPIRAFDASHKPRRRGSMTG